MPVVGSSHRVASSARVLLLREADTARPIARLCYETRAMAVHQLVPTFGAGDATAQAAVHLQLLLRRLGIFGELFAGEVKDGLEGLVRRWTRLGPKPEDLVLYHHGIGSGRFAPPLTLGCRKGRGF